MEFFEVIRKRRSVRHFTDDPVKESDLVAMIEAASLAPSPKNEQPWHFIVIKEKQLIENLRDMVDAILTAQVQAAETKVRKKSLKHQRFGAVNVFDAPVVIVALSRPYPNSDPDEQPIYNQGLQGVAAAIENLHLAAAALGYGGCWAVLPLELGRMEIEAMLGVKKPWFAVAVISVGVPSKQPSPVKRKPLEEIVTFK